MPDRDRSLPRVRARRRSRLRGLGAVGALVVGAGALTSPVAPSVGAAPAAEPASAPLGGPGCAFLAVDSCALPFPTSEWEVPDPSTATGVRLTLPDGALGAGVVEQVGPAGMIQEVAAGADGFSAITPVIFELAEAVDPASLPADGGDALVVLDVDTGARVPIRAEVTPLASIGGGTGTVVMAWPRDQFAYGHQVVAGLTNALRAADGSALDPAPGMATLPMSWALPFWWGFAPAAEIWSSTGIPPSDLLSVTRFTVRSEANASGTFDAMVAAALGTDHPVRNLELRPNYLLVAGAAGIVNGQVLVTDFRDENGVVHAEPSGELWLDFVLVLPERAAGGAPTPVSIYGHGLSIFKETMVVVAGQNAMHGVATIGIDVPYHGSRIADGGFLFGLANPATFGRLSGMVPQGVVDHVSLVSAIQGELSSLDVVPAGGDGVPDLDTETILYAGTSMGGVLGATFASVDERVDSAFIQVGGSGIIDIISHSMLWAVFGQSIPGASAGDTVAMVGLATLALDTADPANFAHRLVDRQVPTFLVYGQSDGIVPNFSSERLARQAALPLIGPQLWEVPDLPIEDQRGVPLHGMMQIDTSAAPDLFRSFLAHMSFTDPAAVALLDTWLDNQTGG